MLTATPGVLPAFLFGAAYLALGLAVGFLAGARELGAIWRELEALAPKGPAPAATRPDAQ